MNLLDNEQTYLRIDPDGMGDLIEGFPAQVEEGWRIGNEASVPGDYGRAANLIVQGMGGSAIGGDLLCALEAGAMKIPAAVVRDYELPGFAGPDTLFAASSYSGNTEETLAGYAEAVKRGCKILVLTTGGELARRARADGFPSIIIPGGLSPRAALGYSFFPLSAVLAKLGLSAITAVQVAETAALLRAGVARWGRIAADSEAKDMAAWLHGRLPLIYAVGSWPGIVARRWKGQINENAKNAAFWSVFPELNHNETVGFEAPPELIARTRVVILRAGEEGPKMAKRIEVTARLLVAAGAGVREVRAEGDSSLARMFNLIQFGDFVSYYLAILNGIDPTPVKVIDLLKKELAGVD